MLKSFLYVLLLISLGGVRVHAQSEAEEYYLKAAFVFNFTRYIDWMPSTMGNDFVIGVIGSSPIVEPLNATAKTNMMNGKHIIIRQINSPGEIGFCHVLFISKNYSNSISIILSNTMKGTLTISETDGAATDGVAMNFILVNNKLKFEANLKAISLAGLKASSELLKLAVIVNDKN